MGKLSDLQRSIADYRVPVASVYVAQAEPEMPPEPEESLSDALTEAIGKVSDSVQGINSEAVASELKALRGAVNRLTNSVSQIKPGDVNVPPVDLSGVESAISRIVALLSVEPPKKEAVRYEIQRNADGFMTGVVVRPDTVMPEGKSLEVYE